MELMDLLVTDDQNLCQEGCTNKKVLDSIMKNKKSFMSKTMVCYTKCPCNCPVSFCSNPDYFVEDPCPSEMEEDEVALCLPISQGVGSADNKDKQPTGSGSERTTKYTVSPTGFAQLSELTSPRTHAAGTTDDERQRTSSHFLPALETSETDGSLKPSQELGTMSAIATTSSANQVAASSTTSDLTKNTATTKYDSTKLQEHASLSAAMTSSHATSTVYQHFSSTTPSPSSLFLMRSEVPSSGRQAFDRTTAGNALTSVGIPTTEETTTSPSSSLRKITQTTSTEIAYASSKPSLSLSSPATQKNRATTFLDYTKHSTIYAHESMTTHVSSSVALPSEHSDTTHRFREKVTATPTQKFTPSRPTIAKTEETLAPFQSTMKNSETSSTTLSVSTTRIDTPGVTTLSALSSPTDVTVGDVERHTSSARTDAFYTLLATSKSAPESSSSSKLTRLSTDRQTTLDAKTTADSTTRNSSSTQSALMTDKRTTSSEATHPETSSFTESVSSADKKSTSSKAITTSQLEVTSNSQSATTAVEDSTPLHRSTSSRPSTMDAVTDQFTLTEPTPSTAMVTSDVDGHNTEAAVTTEKVSPRTSAETNTTTDQPTTGG